MKMLKLDPAFTPCLAEDGDEIFANGVIRWNITKMQEYIDVHPTKIKYKQMELKLLTSDIRNINREHVRYVYLEKPIILVDFTTRIQDHLIDGRHRVTKAREKNLESLPAYKLTPHQHIPFLLSQTGYEAYVRYYNEKVRNG